MIELEILSHTIESYQLEKELDKLGIGDTDDDNEEVGVWLPMTFINIEAFSSTLFYEGKRTLIYCNGTTFVCKMNYKELTEYLKHESENKI